MKVNLNSWLRVSAVRLALFVMAVLIARQLPGALKGPAWLLALGVGGWAFVAFVRDARWLYDRWAPRLQEGWTRWGDRAQRRRGLTPFLSLAAGVLLAGVAVYHAWPAWHFLSTSSLREDEILNIDRYTSRGFAPAVGTYSLARNHIFFNVVNSVLPGADSRSALRGRLVSILAVLGSLGVLVVYSARRGWLLAGVAFAGFVLVDLYALKVLLEGRGYGLIGFFGTLACVAFAEWIRTERRGWLTVLTVTCVLGAYTLPYYVVFGGMLLLLAWVHRPSRETFLAGVFAALAVAMLYLPIVDKVLKVASGYDDEYGESVTYNFGSIEAVYRTMQYLFSYDVVRIGPLFLLVVLLTVVLFATFGRFAEKSDRVAVAGIVAAILTLLAFLFVLASVPIRVSAFLAGPQAVVATILFGSLLAARSLAPVLPLMRLAFAGAAGFLLWNARITEPLIPRQNWEGFATLIERSSPGEAGVWVSGKYDKLVRWYLPDRKFVPGDPDLAALAAGDLVAYDAAFKGGAERKRFSWNTLPDGVRYVTDPLLISYQRMYFVPPRERGISGIVVNGIPVASVRPERQPRDPVTLSFSAGDGDALYPPGSETPFTADPVTLPAEIEITLDPGVRGGSCNLLFSQTLADKVIRAEVRTTAGIRLARRPFVIGELVSIPLPRDDAATVHISLASREGFQPGSRLSGDRPPLAVMDAWVARAAR